MADFEPHPVGTAARIARLEALLWDIIDAWDWWRVDEYDRCQSVPTDEINKAREFLVASPATDPATNGGCCDGGSV